MSAVVDHTVQACLIALPPATRDVTVGLRYERGEPFAAQIVFPAEVSLDGHEVVWAFARELLEEGLRAPAGEGDVHLRPSGPERTSVELRAPEGVAVVEFATADLRDFLHCSYALVPSGEEHLSLDLDRHLAALLGGV